MHKIYGSEIDLEWGDDEAILRGIKVERCQKAGKLDMGLHLGAPLGAPWIEVFLKAPDKCEH